MKRIVWISLIMFAANLFAQSAIPAGTILPVALNSSLNSRKVKSRASNYSTSHAGRTVIVRINDSCWH
jgi:hypothetical protein